MDYSLPGPQVQPDASYWHDGACPTLCVVRPVDVLATHTMPPHPTGGAVDVELAELAALASLRDDPTQVADPTGPAPRQGLSPFLQFRPAPLGVEYDRTIPDPSPAERVRSELDPSPVPVVRTGRQLARAFECEVPGVYLRHVVHALLLQTGGSAPYFVWSPPMQTLVCVALDIALYSAQLAAWHVKWRGGAGVQFRPRPFEMNASVSTLFSREVNALQNGDGAPRVVPAPSPGTPRHPSYPSGHSVTYAAGAELLTYFFPDRAAELNQLADNAGMARLWAGVHYRSDHEQGMALGRAVGRKVIEQLQAACIPLPDPCSYAGNCGPTMTATKVAADAQKMSDHCPCS
jgi:hypothetical protein